MTPKGGRMKEQQYFSAPMLVIVGGELVVARVPRGH